MRRTGEVMLPEIEPGRKVIHCGCGADLTPMTKREVHFFLSGRLNTVSYITLGKYMKFKFLPFKIQMFILDHFFDTEQMRNDCFSELNIDGELAHDIPRVKT